MTKSIVSLILKLRNRYLFYIDVVAALLIPFFVLLLRFEDFEDVTPYFGPLAIYTLCALAWKIAVFMRSGVYSRYWRYASVDDLAILAIGTTASGVVGMFIFFAILRPLGIIPASFPRSVPVLDAAFTMIVVGSLRFIVRLAFYLGERLKHTAPAKRTLIVGAGVAGSMVLKELRTNRDLGLEPVGLIDDDRNKINIWVHGVPVLGNLGEMETIIRTYRIEEVVIAIPSATGKVVREVMEACKRTGVPSKTIPGIFEILRGSASVAQIRNIQLEDLLRRGTVKTNGQSIAALISNARIMVTGAGGSIGSELCRQIKDFGPSEIILLGHGENSIFQIARELQAHPRKGSVVYPVIADIREKELMRHILRYHRPQIIFHTAAHKHVGLMQANVEDAVTNNILGTQTLVDLAEESGIERFVMISSDKAVNPTSIMGVTKRIAELVVQESGYRSGRAFVTVRFGNVLGSRGSVVPIFERQIEAGGPITVTHPEVKRFFMTIPEAVHLVLLAGAMGSGGEVFVLDMGEQIKVADLARDLIRLSGLKEGVDIDIKYTGLLPGEKISEELFYEGDIVERTEHESILVCRRDASHNGNDYDQFPQDLPFRHAVDTLVEAAQQGSAPVIRRLLKKLVPQYLPAEEAPPQLETFQATASPEAAPFHVRARL